MLYWRLLQLRWQLVLLGQWLLNPALLWLLWLLLQLLLWLPLPNGLGGLERHWGQRLQRARLPKGRLLYLPGTLRSLLP